MTPLLYIGAIEAAAADRGLHDIRILAKRVDVITTFDMMVVAKLAELRLGRKEGRAFMKLVIAELSKAKILGVIDECEATRYALPYPRMTLGELRVLLSRFTLDERRLIVFALASGMGLTEASFLQHKEIKIQSNINKWSTELRRFVSMIPRHIRCPFVFWESDRRGEASAMVGFEARFRSVTKASWPVFASLCENLIPLDTHEDAKEFATMFVLDSVHA